MENVQTIPPPYVVRTVLIYSRHAGQLQFNPSEAFSVSGVFVVAFGVSLTSLNLARMCLLPQKMLQSPYFFFDVVYLHNGVEEQGDETSWRVSKSADWTVVLSLMSLQLKLELQAQDESALLLCVISSDHSGDRCCILEFLSCFSNTPTEEM